MNDRTLAQIARNIIAGFMLTLGIIPNEGEDDIETRDYGPHRVYTQMARVPDSVADTIDPAEAVDKLTSQIRCPLTFWVSPTSIRSTSSKRMVSSSSEISV